MADRRGDERPLAPQRPLAGPTTSAGSGNTGSGRGGLGQRMSAAMASAGTAVKPGRGSSASAGTATQPNPTPAKASSRPSESSDKGGASARPRGTRRARLRLVHVDPWSVMKTAFLLSIALGIVTVVAVFVVWSVLGAAGVWDSINRTVADVLGGDSAQNFDVENYVGTSRVMGFTMVVAVFDVLLVTAVATLGAFLYNLAAALLGGVEITLAEDER